MKAGDVIGWVKNSSSGDLSFETTIDDQSFFYLNANFNTTTGSTLQASAGFRRHKIKHLLRAHVSQPSLASVNYTFMKHGIYNVTALVKNSAGSIVGNCSVSVQV